MLDFEVSATPIQLQPAWRSAAIGLFSLLHIVPAALSIGYLVLAPVLEWRGRSRPFETDLARALTRFTILVFSVSTVLAVIMVELLIGLFPVTTMWLWNQFHSSLYVAMGAFLGGLLALYPYYHWWEQIRRRSVAVHLLMGSVAALGMLVWVIVLDGMGSYMLTPEQGVEGSRVNPPWIALVVHRLLADLVIAGYGMAGFAAWRLSRTPEGPDHSYYAHVVKMGWLLGLAGLLLQPLSGLIYAESIARSSPVAYGELVHGRFQVLLFLQFSLIALLFLGNLFLIRRARGNGGGMGWVDAVFVIVTFFMVVFSAQATMRRLWLLVLVCLTLWSLWARPRVVVLQADAWTTPFIRTGCIGLAIVSIVLYLTMGVIRETIRHPDTVRGIITLEDHARYPLVSREEP